jgi:chemotaxis protein CheD
VTLTETVVRMGERAVSASAGDVLVSIGLGSCIGLALIDRARGIAGLAHVMLPAAPADGHEKLGKFADTAVPALVGELVELGARRIRLEAALVGGAQMFSFEGGAMDIGARNDAATRAALAAVRVPLAAAATGGAKGRTVRLHVGTGAVTVKEAGGVEVELLSSAPGRR